MFRQCALPMRLGSVLRGPHQVVAQSTNGATEGRTVSNFGAHVDFSDDTLAATWAADLNGAAFRFVDTRQTSFQLRVNCSSVAAAECVADGDQVRTVA